MNELTLQQEQENNVRAVAKEFLDIDTLERRHIDDLDFHDISVVRLKRALDAAYDRGFDAGQSTT